VLPADEEVLEAMAPWKVTVDEMGKVVVGTTKVDLTKDDCAAGECNLGNYFCDAMVHSVSGAFLQGIVPYITSHTHPISSSWEWLPMNRRPGRMSPPDS